MTTALIRSFQGQIEALACAGDVAVGIFDQWPIAERHPCYVAGEDDGADTIGLTGSAGMGWKDVLDHCIYVPSTETPRIQERHVLIGHIIAELIEHGL